MSLAFQSNCKKGWVMAASAGKRNLEKEGMMAACDNPKMDTNNAGQEKKNSPDDSVEVTFFISPFKININAIFHRFGHSVHVQTHPALTARTAFFYFANSNRKKNQPKSRLRWEIFNLIQYFSILSSFYKNSKALLSLFGGKCFFGRRLRFPLTPISNLSITVNYETSAKLFSLSNCKLWNISQAALYYIGTSTKPLSQSCPQHNPSKF